MPDPVMTREDIYRQPATAAERGVIHKRLPAWERIYNLTAVRDPAEMLTHHLLDSLSVVTPLRVQPR